METPRTYSISRSIPFGPPPGPSVSMSFSDAQPPGHPFGVPGDGAVIVFVDLLESSGGRRFSGFHGFCEKSSQKRVRHVGFIRGQLLMCVFPFLIPLRNEIFQILSEAVSSTRSLKGVTPPFMHGVPILFSRHAIAPVTHTWIRPKIRTFSSFRDLRFQIQFRKSIFPSLSSGFSFHFTFPFSSLSIRTI